MTVVSFVLISMIYSATLNLKCTTVTSAFSLDSIGLNCIFPERPFSQQMFCHSRKYKSSKPVNHDSVTVSQDPENKAFIISITCLFFLQLQHVKISSVKISGLHNVLFH